MKNLLEDSRRDLISQSKRSDAYEPNNREFGKNRHQRRLKSKIANSVSDYNKIDMNKLFKEGILEVNIRVHGETNIYLVTINIEGILNSLAGFLPEDATEDDLEYKIVSRAILDAFNNNEIKVHCTCPDFQYREAYWATVNGTNAGPAETRPSDETNPNDTKGYCKHINLVLNNNSWIRKITSVVYNYINYMRQHEAKKYQKVIYPAIFDTEYIPPEDIEDPDDMIADIPDDELETDEDTIDVSNKWAKTKNQFKPGNKEGIRFTSSPEKELDIDSIDIDNSEEN